MIHSFALRNYAVGTVYSKTETVFVALFATFIAHEPLKLGAWVGILICLGGVMILTVRGNFASVVITWLAALFVVGYWTWRLWGGGAPCPPPVGLIWRAAL